MIKSWNIEEKEADKGWNDFKRGIKTYTDKLQNFCRSMIAQDKHLDDIKSENSNGMISIGSTGLVPLAFCKSPNPICHSYKMNCVAAIHRDVCVNEQLRGRS